MKDLALLIKSHLHLFDKREIDLLRFFVTHENIFWSVEDICKEIKVNERALRGSGEDEGLRLSTSRKLWTFSDYKIVSRTERPSGLKLSNNKEEWFEAASQIESHLWHEKRNAEHFREDKKGLPLFEQPLEGIRAHDHPIIAELKKQFGAVEV